MARFLDAPNRIMTRDQAIMAMMLAEEVNRVPAHARSKDYKDEFWTRIIEWSVQLGIGSGEAVTRASKPPA